MLLYTSAQWFLWSDTNFMNCKRFISSFFDRLLWHAHGWLNNWPFSGGEKRRKTILWCITILSSVILNWFLWYYDVCCQFHTNKLHCEKPRLLLDIATLTMCGRISVLMALIIYSNAWCLICKKRESQSMQMSYITGKGLCSLLL